jgi:short-subunit dehydrogenase
MLTEAARVEYAGSGVSFTCVMPSFTATELIAGTRGTRFVATVSPEDVAVAIADAIEAPRADVYVPRSVGHIARLNALAGRRVRDGIARRLGADRTFLDVDHGARGDYEQRIGGR